MVQLHGHHTLIPNAYLSKYLELNNMVKTKMIKQKKFPNQCPKIRTNSQEKWQNYFNI